jgi:hypothetical protein
MDYRSNTSYDVYAQQLTASGEAKWAANGIPVTTAPLDQNSPNIAVDAGTAVIVTWDDIRSGGYDPYAQRVEFRHGYWGKPEPQLASAADVKADQGGHVKLNWYASGRDALNQQLISHYSIWRAVDVAAVSNENLVSLSDVGKEFTGPAFRSEKTPTVDYFWELIGTQDAIYRTAYSFVAETRYDSTATGVANHQFQIVAHAYYSQYINWPSNVLAAHSVDNLAPAAPLLLTAQRIGNYVYLTWNRVRVPDLRDYSVYRKTSSGVTPVPLNFLSSANDTVLTDQTPPASALYYIVTAYDVHANQGAPSNEASVQAATGIGNTPPITALTVLQNQPNPFAGTTNLLVGLPASSDLSIEVYDVAGRRVRAQTLAQQPAGWRSIPFDGHTLASGVYFYRVSANGKTATTKMVIAR